MNILHEDEDVEIVSEGLVGFDYVGMVDLGQNFKLGKQLIFHTVFFDDRFEDLFQGVQSVSLEVS